MYVPAPALSLSFLAGAARKDGYVKNRICYSKICMYLQQPYHFPFLQVLQEKMVNK